MRKIKIIAYFLGFALLVCYSGVFIVDKINAAEVTGWLWGGSEDATIGGRTCTYGVDANDPACKDGNETGVGWISMSRKNCNPTGDGTTEGGAALNPNYPDCPDNQPVTRDANYGVIIPDANGNVTGYAWSENLGWISFKETDLIGCPTMPCNARKDGDYLYGWARIMGIVQAGTDPITGNSGGWQGWIKLKGTTQGGQDYGVELDKMDGNKDTHTYAWSNELGWIDFGQALYVQKKVLVCPEQYSLKISPGEPNNKEFKAYYVNENIYCSDIGTTPEILDSEANWGTTSDTMIQVETDGVATALLGTNKEWTADVNATYNGISGSAAVCISDGSCAADTCQGTTCSECGFDPIEGTKDCGGTDWQEVVN